MLGKQRFRKSHRLLCIDRFFGATVDQVILTHEASMEIERLLSRLGVGPNKGMRHTERDVGLESRHDVVGKGGSVATAQEEDEE